ncbi:MAG TPA: hypothetical protein VE575_04550 [Acidimicrobiales bacterium]|nr:hypothetical protein [Acidimicrobiales bacterium]
MDNAETAMELLPPVGWADVVTNRELDHLRIELTQRIEAAEQRIEAAEQRMLAALHQEIAAVNRQVAAVHQQLAATHQQLALFVRSIVIWGTGLVTALASLAFTAGHLL